MAVKYAAARGASRRDQELAGVEGFAYALVRRGRAPMGMRTALVLLGVLIAGAGVLLGFSTFYGASLNEQKVACLELAVAQREACLDRLAVSLSSLQSGYPFLVLIATLVSLLIAAYVSTAIVRLVDERRRHHAALLAEERLGRLERAFVEGHVSERSYEVLRRWLDNAAQLEARGDDWMQAGRVARAIALFAFPLSLLPVVALFARAALSSAPAGTVQRSVTQAAGSITSNPLLTNPLLEAALRPVTEVLQDASGAIDLGALLGVAAPTLLLCGVLWVGTAVAATYLYLRGRDWRAEDEKDFQTSWHMVLLAARERRDVEGVLPIEPEEERKMAA